MVSRFNPRTPAGCDTACRSAQRHDRHVSTHAPLRGATNMWRYNTPKTKVSTHAPLRGATSNLPAFPYLSPTVSTHAPLRGATLFLLFCALFSRVSTHAPLRGATCPWRRRRQRRTGFNPRTPAGCDTGFSSSCSTRRAFQPTHPCGVRRRDVEEYLPKIAVSTHAPLRGATGGYKYEAHH